MDARVGRNAVPLKFERKADILISDVERRGGARAATVGRAPARDARHARSQGPAARVDARVGNHRATRAGISQRVARGTGLALSGAVSARGTRPHLVILG